MRSPALVGLPIFLYNLPFFLDCFHMRGIPITGFQFCQFTITVFIAYKKNKKLCGCNSFNTIIFPFDVNIITVNDLINAHSQINAPYLIDAPLEVYSLY